jgi:hypothetical protein
MILSLNQELESRLRSQAQLWPAKERLGRSPNESRPIMLTLSFVFHDPRPTCRLASRRHQSVAGTE